MTCPNAAGTGSDVLTVTRAWSTCDQTFSSSTGLLTAVAANPSTTKTLCLNNGSYGSLSFNSISRSAYVTIKSTTGTGASLTVDEILASTFLRFESLTLGGIGNLGNCSRNIQIVDNAFTGSQGINIWNRDDGCSATAFTYLIDGNTFADSVSTTGQEGKISVTDDNGAQPSADITISDNTLTGGSCNADGIFLAGGASGVTIGPGNVFQDFDQVGETHCDMIQFFGDGQNNIINGNWFKDGATVLTHHTATPDNTQFTNNIISNCLQFQADNTPGFLFQHNTVYNLTDVMNWQSQGGGGATFTARSNILLGSIADPNTAGGSFSGSYNLCQTSGDCGGGTNNLTGTPTFVGGSAASITTFAGWQLANGSTGENSAHDGADRGTTYYGSAPAPAPSPVALVRQLWHRLYGDH